MPKVGNIAGPGSGLVGLCFILLLTSYTSASAGKLFRKAIIADGDFYANFRYRFEHVDDDLTPDDADAHTLRSVIGYQSGDYYDFSVLLEAEQVSRLGGDFREFPGSTSNRSHAVVADPDGTELNQGYLQYRAAGNNRLRVGRQAITYREAPLHRFIGTVLWRQNWQTFDAVSLENRYFSDTRLNYAWIGNVNRIFGDNAPAALSDFDSNSHLFNIRYEGFGFADLETYAYLLDFDNALSMSSQTYGIRLSGDHPLSSSVTSVYALEFAYQTNYGNNPIEYDAGYYLVQAGFNFTRVALLDELLFKIGYEHLGGTGGFAFQTPLGTNHAFQGTADRFLTTPADGVRDFNLITQAAVWGFELTASYHLLESDEFDYEYGTELDIQLTREVGRYFGIGIKYAAYEADRNAANLLRNSMSAVTADARKFWVFITADF